MDDKAPPQVSSQSEVEKTQRELEALRAAYTRTLLEKNLLQHAVSELNDHHNAPEAIIYLDAEGRVVYANSYFLEMMGISSLMEIINVPLPADVWADRVEAARLFQDVQASGVVRERAISLFDRSGQPIRLTCSGIATKTADGQFAGIELTLCEASGEHTFQGELLQRNALLEAILASAPHAILVLSPSSSLLRANPAALTLFKLEPGSEHPSLESVMRNVQIPEDLIGSIQLMLQRGETFRCDIHIGPSAFILQGAPLQDNQAGWVLVLNDVSSLKELDALKTRMLRMASHDLKNPLSIIVSYTQMLLGLPNDEEQKTYLNAILQCTSRMFGIITDLLDLERAKAGQLILTSIELKSFLQAIVAEYETQIVDKEQTLSVELLLGELFIDGDAEQLREALRNLLDNAIKYTAPGGTIRVTLRQEGSHARIEVADNGCGIPSGALEKLFQPFFRVRTSDTINIPGTGLGLSLAKSIIDAHSGRIWVQSQQGQGSCFFVDLPIAQS
jgi:signal transduction histidine kinase